MWTRGRGRVGEGGGATSGVMVTACARCTSVFMRLLAHAGVGCAWRREHGRFQRRTRRGERLEATGQQRRHLGSRKPSCDPKGSRPTGQSPLLCVRVSPHSCVCVRQRAWAEKRARARGTASCSRQEQQARGAVRRTQAHTGGQVYGARGACGHADLLDNPLHAFACNRCSGCAPRLLTLGPALGRRVSRRGAQGQ